MDSFVIVVSIFVISVITSLLLLLPFYQAKNEVKNKNRNENQNENEKDVDSSHSRMEGYVTHDINDHIKSIPNIIWTYTGSSNNHPTYQLCIDSWRYYNPTTDIIVLTSNNVHEYVEPTYFNTQNLETDQKAHDFLPIYLLQKYGGIWMSPSMICTRSLEWVHKKERKDFIGYYMGDLETNRNPILETWFLAAPKDSKLMFEVMKEFERLISFEDTSKYVDTLKEMGLQIQAFPYPEFFKLHLIFQKVLRGGGPNIDLPTYSVDLIDAIQEDSPLFYLSANDWNSTDALKWLCEHRYISQIPLIYLRPKELELIERGEADIDCFASFFRSSNDLSSMI